MPSAGQNMRDSVRQPAIACESVNTKNPAAPSCADSVVSREKSGLSCLSCSVLRTPISRRVPAPPTMRSGQRVSMSPVDRASASSTARRSRSLSWRPSGGDGCRTAMRRAAPEPRTSTSTSPDFWRWRRRPPAPAACTSGAPSRDSTKWVATVAWPTKLASVRGVKKRTRRSWSAPSGLSTNAVSALLSSRAMASISASVSDSASSTTPAGLPVKRSAVKASTWKIRIRRLIGARILPANPRHSRSNFRVLSASPRGGQCVLHGPEMRIGREPVEPDPASTGGGIGMHASLRATCAIPFLFVIFSGTASAAGASDGDSSSLDEVVVTAELRDRSLGDLPASATVLDSHTLEIAGVQHFQDVLSLVPNLNWSAGTSRPRFFQLRGIGELSQWQGAPNPSVGFLIDGIDFSGIGMPATLADVDRIEVLRGPQGTAYGANALAGLIAVNTRAPSREASANADVTLGDYGTSGVNGVVGGPVGDGEAAWRLAAGHYQSDGFRRNSYLDRDDTNGYNESNARLRFKAHPSESLHIDVTALWADLDNGYDAFSIDNSRTTLSDKPGQDTQITRALAVRLDFTGAESFDVLSRS